LFPRLAFGDQERRSHHRVVRQARAAVGQLEQAVAAQVLQEQERADALVAVGEGMVLVAIAGAPRARTVGYSGLASKVCSIAPRIASSCVVRSRPKSGD